MSSLVGYVSSCALIGGIVGIAEAALKIALHLPGRCELYMMGPSMKESIESIEKSFASMREIYDSSRGLPSPWLINDHLISWITSGTSRLKQDIAVRAMELIAPDLIDTGEYKTYDQCFDMESKREIFSSTVSWVVIVATAGLAAYVYHHNRGLGLGLE